MPDVRFLRVTLYFTGKINTIFPVLPKGRVSDPHWFNADPDTDPDPAFFLIAIPDPDPGFDDLKLKKITDEKKIN